MQISPNGRAKLSVSDATSEERKRIWEYLFQGSTADVPDGSFTLNIVSDEALKLAKALRDDPKTCKLSLEVAI
jgi:hypothetical protein